MSALREATELTRIQHWDWAQVYARFSATLPPEAMVQSVHVVAVTRRSPITILCCSTGADGPWFLPGGTREPSEPIATCLERELREEAGARIIGDPVWLGAHHAIGYRDRPYRPHLPHPYKAWVWCAADVIVDGEPTNPPGAEQVTSVRAVSVAQAKKLLGSTAKWYPALLDRAVAALANSDESAG